MLAIAIRGPVAAKMRQMAESYQMSGEAVTEFTAGV
jgi:hypothetical protein